MKEDDRKEKDFKVEDRRTSSGGSESDGEPPREPEGTGTEQGGPVPEKDAGQPGRGGTAGPLEVDFSTFVFSLFSSALIQLGDMADPISGTMETNLVSAKQTIDIIDILKEKTEGNLSEEESRLLENISAELKWKYLAAVKGNR